MKTILWAMRHPINALCWYVFGEPYSAVRDRFWG